MGHPFAARQALRERRGQAEESGRTDSAPSRNESRADVAETGETGALPGVSADGQPPGMQENDNNAARIW